jgi:rod shape-determining protein MreB
VRVAGNKIDDAIADYLRKKHNLLIGDQTAEGIKIELGSAVEPEKTKSQKIKGRDSVYGLPKAVTITNEEVNKAINQPLSQILSAIREVLEQTPPELVADIVDKGVVLSGGTSLLNGLDTYLSDELNVAVHRVDEPMLSVVKGTALALENLDLYKQAIRQK